MKKFSHDAMFPEELAKRVIKLFSYKNDVVLDPFNGVETTKKVAKSLGRKFIGIDIDKTYCEIAQKRVDETEEIAEQLILEYEYPFYELGALVLTRCGRTLRGVNAHSEVFRTLQTPTPDPTSGTRQYLFLNSFNLGKPQPPRSKKTIFST
jgi:hypothetical protein